MTDETGCLPQRNRSRHSATIVRVVNDLSSKHGIVFESISRKLHLGVSDQLDADACRRTFTGVVNELFSDGCYNWGRVATVFAFAGWLARACIAADSTHHSPQEWCDIVSDIATEYIALKLADWVCKQGGWDAMDRFFAQPESLETKMWRGLLYTFFGLGAMATIAAVVR